MLPRSQVRVVPGERPFGLPSSTMTATHPLDDRAVTPVIGIVLIVALAVILASLVSIQAFGLFGVANGPGPTMDFAFDYNKSAGSGDTDSWGNTTSFEGAQGLLEITYQGGENVEPERLTVLRGSDEFAVSDPVNTEKLEVGETVKVWVADDTTVRVIWRDPGGEKTAAVAVWDDGQ